MAFTADIRYIGPYTKYLCISFLTLKRYGRNISTISVNGLIGKYLYGWLPNGPVGSIWTTFQGTGTGTLSFGNCHKGGNVKVFLKEKSIAEATSLQRKEIFFDYSVGDILKIREYNTAIWKFYSFSVQCN